MHVIAPWICALPAGEQTVYGSADGAGESRGRGRRAAVQVDLCEALETRGIDC